MKPAVIEPSHMPKINLTANKLPKLLQAACEQSATPQTKMLMLGLGLRKLYRSMFGKNLVPHPFTDGETLKCEILRVFEDQVTEIEDRSEPIVPGKGMRVVNGFGIKVSLLRHTGL